MTTTATAPDLAAVKAPLATRGARIRAVNLTLRHGNGAIGLDDASLTIEPGQLTAVIVKP